MAFDQVASFLDRESGTSVDPQGVPDESTPTGAASGKTGRA